MTIAVARPQPAAPRAGIATLPSGVGTLAPKTSRALTGTFNVKAASCIAITAFGRETATLKPR